MKIFFNVLIIIALALCWNSDATAISSNSNERISDFLFNDVETLKFRINELTREIALMKTAVLKLTADASSKDLTDSKPSKKSKASADNKKTVLNNDNLTTVSVENSKQPEKKTVVEKKDFDFNMIYQSRAEINEPLRYSIMIQPSALNEKNLTLIFEFSQNMLFIQNMSSDNISLFSEKKNDKIFKFRLLKNTDANIRLTFRTGITGVINAEALLFSDINDNKKLDAREKSTLKNIVQNIMLGQ